MSVTIFDIVLFFITLAGGFLVWQKGFFAEISSKASYLIGLLFSFLLSKPLAVFVSGVLQIYINPILLSFLSYYVLFFCGSFLTKWIGSALSSAFEQLGIGVIDRMLGFMLGCFEMALVLSLIIILLEMQPFVDLGNVFNSSKYCHYIVNSMRLLFSLGKSAFLNRK